MCKGQKKPTVLAMRESLIELITHIEKDQDRESAIDLERRITLAARVLKNADVMSKEDMIRIAEAEEKGLGKNLQSENEYIILEWINDRFMEVTLQEKLDVLGVRDGILTRMESERISKNPGTGKMMPISDDDTDGDASAKYSTRHTDRDVPGPSFSTASPVGDINTRIYSHAEAWKRQLM
jgi:hypothetical protein